MGIDIEHKHKKSSVRKLPKSRDIYLRLLVRLYSFLARRTRSNFNKAIFKRLCMSRVNRRPISMTMIKRNMRGKEGKTAVIVGSVTDDKRQLKVPKLSIVALRFSEEARRRIIKAGGECLTFDQLALKKTNGFKYCSFKRT